MLKAIVEQMQLRSEPGLRKASRFVAIFAHNHRHLQLARDQKGSSPNSCGSPAGSTRRTPFDWRPYPRESTSNFTPRAFSNSPSSSTNGVFARPASGKISDADHGP